MARIGLAALLMALAVLEGCGSRHVAAEPARTFAADQSWNGRTIAIKAGDTVELSLPESRPVPGSSLRWDATSSAPEVLTRISVRREPTQQRPTGDDRYIAGFRAARPGAAVIQASGTTTCEAMAKPACPDRAFALAVKVT